MKKTLLLVIGWFNIHLFYFIFLFWVLKFHYLYPIISYSIRSQLWDGLEEQTSYNLSTYLSNHDVQEEDPILVLEFLPYFDTVRIFPNNYCILLLIAYTKIYYITKFLILFSFEEICCQELTK